MAGFTVRQAGLSYSRNPAAAKVREFDSYGKAEDYFRSRIEKFQRDGYQIEWRRTMAQHHQELINDTAKTDVIWSIKASRGIRPGRGIFLSMRPIPTD